MTEQSKPNGGSKRIRELFPGRGGAAKVAKEMSVDPSVAGRWFSGERKPLPAMRARLERLYGIGWQLWDEEDGTDGGAAPAA